MANFTELDRYLFGQATHYDIYRKLGAHFAEVKGVKGVYFDLWAPNAERVFLIGSFNGWNETANEMTRLKPETMGIYELFIPGLKEGELYKYLIETKDGKRLYKADPYAIMQNSGREQHLRLRILNILNGQTASGWRIVKRRGCVCTADGNLRGSSGLLETSSGQG